MPDASAKAEPLHDGRERRLRDVRQLTHGLFVASTRFAADGSAVWFLAREGQQISVRRVPVAGGPVTTLPAARAGTPWGLTDGAGGPCVVWAPASCPTESWPEPQGLLSCDGLVLLPAGPGITCFDPLQSPPPCVATAHGASACPTPHPGATDVAIVLKPTQTAAAIPLAPRPGLSLSPVFSPGAQRLLYVARSEGAFRLWTSFTDPALAGATPLGPEAHRTVDATFAPSGEAVIFASTLDDAAGQELDLELLMLASGALERVTFTTGVDRFPTFSPDGRSLAWVSERNADPGLQDLFIAQWVWDLGAHH